MAGVLQEAGMLTQGPAPDPKCKLNISSFLTLPHLSGCLICTRNSMFIVLVLQMMGDGIGRWWLIYNRVWEGGTGGGYHLVVFFISLVFLSFVLSCSLSLCFYLGCLP